MRKSKINKAEQDLLESFERGEWDSVKNIAEERLRFQQYADATFRKDSRVNIRISARDLDQIRKKAMEEGLPYQTLIASVLHKYISGRLVERS